MARYAHSRSSDRQGARPWGWLAIAMLVLASGCDLDAVGAWIPADLPEPHDPAGHHAIEEPAEVQAHRVWSTDQPTAQLTRALFVQQDIVH